MIDAQSHRPRLARCKEWRPGAATGAALLGLALSASHSASAAPSLKGRDGRTQAAKATSSKPLSAGVIIARLKTALNDARITPTVVPLGAGDVAVRLDGVLSSEAEVKAALHTANLFVPRDIAGVISGLTWEAAAPSLPSSMGPSPVHPVGAGSAIQQDIANAIGNDKRITVQVFEFSPGKYVVRLDGAVPTAEEKAGIFDTVNAFAPLRIDRVASQLRVDPKAPSAKDAANPPKKPAEAKTVEVVWPLTFGPEALNANDGNKLSANRYEIDTLVAALNKAYKKPDATVDIVQATRHALLIKGPEDVVYQIRRDLVQLDAPGPQVQLDLWAVQLSGQDKDIQQRHAVMQEHLREGQTLLAQLPLALEGVIGYGAPYPSGTLDKLPRLRSDWYNGDEDALADVYGHSVELETIRKELKNLQSVGFDLNPMRRLTLPEMLIFLSIPDNAHKSVLFDELAANTYKAANLRAVGDDLKFVSDAEKVPDQAAFLQDRVLKLHEKDVMVNGHKRKWVPFWRLRNAYLSAVPAQNPVRRGINDFLEAAQFFQANPTLPKAAKSDGEATADNAPDASLLEGSAPDAEAIKAKAEKAVARAEFQSKIFTAQSEMLRTAQLQGNNPEYLARQAAVVDGFLKIAADALAADIQELYVDPLLEQLRLDNSSVKSSGGVSMVGRTRLVVTSGLQSSLTPQFQGSVDSTVPAPFDADTLLGAALPAQGSPGSGAARLLGGLSQTEAVLLAGALAKPVTPSYTTVAPGVGITVRPTVMGNGAAARLQIEATFGVESTAPSANATGNTWQPQPVDTVKTHTVATDAVINGLDLFDVSSFGLVTRHPKGPGYVPVLGRLPLIGPAFQWRRKDAQIDHDSVILVNAVILPRALDIVRYYSTPYSVGSLLAPREK